MIRMHCWYALVAIGLAGSACATIDKTAKPRPTATTSTSTPPKQPDTVATPDATACVGKKVEVIEEKFSSGDPKIEREVVRLDDGTVVSHGKTTLYWETGGKKTELVYVCGERHGQKRTWHASGKKWQEGAYFANRDHGTWTEWYPDGTMARRWSMTYGAWHGIYAEWHPNGNKRLEVEWVNGMRQGVETLRDELGIVGRTTIYVDGVPQPGRTP